MALLSSSESQTKIKSKWTQINQVGYEDPQILIGEEQSELVKENFKSRLQEFIQQLVRNPNYKID